MSRFPRFPKNHRPIASPARTHTTGAYPTCARAFLALLTLLAAGCVGPRSAQNSAGADPSSRPDSTSAGASSGEHGRMKDPYVVALETWRAEREAGLRKENGWLTLVGLYWFEPGPNTAGSEASRDLLFPEGAPALVGTFHLEDGIIRFEAAPGVTVTHAQQPVTTLVLHSDQEEDTTVLQLDTYSFYVVERGEKVGLRLKDTAAQALQDFSALEYFRLDRSWRVTAKLVRHDPPREVHIPNVLGQVDAATSPGTVVFEREGRTFHIEALDAGDALWLIFGDQTNGHETYGGGRFLVTEPVQPDGTVEVDFNRAYNPPCVFSPYATCPLPPKENKLAIRVTAGEKMYGGSAGH